MLKKLTAVLLLVLLLVGCTGGGTAVSSSTPEESKPAVSSKVESKPVSSKVESKPAVSSKTESKVESKAPEVTALSSLRDYFQSDAVTAVADDTFAGSGNFGVFSFAAGSGWSVLNAKLDELQKYPDDVIEEPFLFGDYDFPVEVRPVWNKKYTGPASMNFYDPKKHDFPVWDMLIAPNEAWSSTGEAEVKIYACGYYDSAKDAELLFSGKLNQNSVVWLQEVKNDYVNCNFFRFDVTVAGKTYRAYCFPYGKNINLSGSNDTVSANGNFYAHETLSAPAKSNATELSGMVKVTESTKGLDVSIDNGEWKIGKIPSGLPVDFYFSAGNGTAQNPPMFRIVAKENCEIRLSGAISMLNVNFGFPPVCEGNKVIFEGTATAGDCFTVSAPDHFRLLLWVGDKTYTLIGQFNDGYNSSLTFSETIVEYAKP